MVQILLSSALAVVCGAVFADAHPGAVPFADVNPLAKRANPPAGELPFDFANHPFIAQTGEDRRSPCPALNTLANHGYLPRNGLGISRQDLSQAFSDGWGVGQSVIAMATDNAFSVCQFRNGAHACDETFDLDDLNEPNTFEHDHSFSRQDHLMLYGGQLPINNHDFNRTIFGNSLQALQKSPTANIEQFDELRLVRESNSFRIDGANNFHPAYFTQLTEIGFIFSVMRNFNATRNGVPIADPNNGNDQTFQVDWWQFWFSRQEFPVELGWRKPITNVENPYVTTIRSSIQSATATSSPSPSPPGVASSLTTDPLFQTNMKRQEPAAPTTTPVPSSVSFNTGASPAPTPSQASISLPNFDTIVPILPTALSHISSAISAAKVTSPPALMPYEISYSPDDLSSHVSQLVAYQSAFLSAAESVLGGVLKRDEAGDAAPTST